MGDTHVSIGDMEEALARASSLMNAMETFLNSANAAANEAIEAVGGTSTEVGAAMNDVIVAVNSEDFKKSKANAENMISNVKKVKTTYADANADLLAKIKSYKTQA